MNGTDPNSLCEKGQFPDDGKKMGIDLGVMYMCGSREWFGTRIDLLGSQKENLGTK